jgi:very-short-patch-repair endonuclease
MTKKLAPAGALDRAKSLRRNMTDAERRLAQILKLGELATLKFRRQVPIGPYIVDFICHQVKLVIEVDGGQHDPESQDEMSRTLFLNREGYRVLRLWNNEVLSNLPGVYEAIVGAIGVN